jgi:hypothetical protein
MPVHQRWFRRAVALVLPGCLLVGPMVTLVWSAKLCPHRHAMQHQHGPCFCDRMERDAPMDLVNPAVLPAATVVVATPGPQGPGGLGVEHALPASPTYAPGHPPPKTPLV